MVPKSYWRALHLLNFRGLFCHFGAKPYGESSKHDQTWLKKKLRFGNSENFTRSLFHVFPWISKWIQKFPPHIENHPSQTWQISTRLEFRTFFLDETTGGWLASRMKLPCCNFRSCSRCLRSSVDVFPRFSTWNSCEKWHHWNTCDTYIFLAQHSPQKPIYIS